MEGQENIKSNVDQKLDEFLADWEATPGKQDRQFGLLLRAILKASNLTNNDLGKAAGINPNLIAKYRSGKASCSVDRAKLLADALGCSDYQRRYLYKAAAFTTKDPIGEYMNAVLLNHGVEKGSITNITPSPAADSLSITTNNNRVVTVTFLVNVQ